jgi:hypothetical protein
MNMVEGSRRTTVAGRTMVLSAALVLACLGLCALCNALISSPVLRVLTRSEALPGILLALGLWTLIFGMLLWIAGWILGGFAVRREDTFPDRARSLPSHADPGSTVQELRR